MLVYAELLNTLLKRHPHGSTIPLVQVIAPLFAHAQVLGGNADQENSAALTALAAYLAGISLPKLLEGDSQSIRRATWLASRVSAAR
jgi:hypothetical protein